MIYLLIIVGAFQLLLFFYCYKMLLSVKRRHRVIDAHIRSLTEWVVTSNKSVVGQLTKMNELLQNTTDNKGQLKYLQQLNNNSGKLAETVLRPVNGYAG